MKNRKRSNKDYDNFYIPLELLNAVRDFCAKNDYTRGQFYRHAIREQLRKYADGDFIMSGGKN
jgi:hypothetical protein